MTGAPAALQLPGMNKSQEIGSKGENSNLVFIRNKILRGKKQKGTIIQMEAQRY